MRVYTRSCECGECRVCKDRERKARKLQEKPDVIKAQRKKSYLKNLEKRREGHRKYYQENAEMLREKARKRKPTTSREQRNVYLRVDWAIKTGKLLPQPCEDCGLGTNATRADGRRLVQAHHEDYAKPLEVCWLCARCHAARHWKYQ